DLTPNTWYAVSDLIEYMKQHHPWFLIPKEVFILENAGWKKPKKRVKYDRYYNFQEGKEHYGRLADSHIADDDPLGFEKVEGRFIERFLEDYIFSLGYADLAYSKEPYKGNGPEMGTLQAFRLSPTFIQVLNNQPIPVKVSVQPNFEIYIDAPAYPIATLRALKPFTNVVKEDRQIILKLEKQHVLSYLIENPDFNINGFLNALSDTPIPQNIITEIREWSERTDVFTLYEQFGIYESRKKQAAADIHTELNITPSICLVNRPIVLYDKLRKQRAIPLCVVHPDKNFQLLPQKAKTVFLTRKVVKWKKVVKKKVQIERKELVTYTVSNQALYDALLLAVLKARFSVEADKKKRSLTFLKREEAQIKTLLNDMKDNYQIKIKKIL
ncbi:MAG: hypothetical protein GY705_01410, partial [Bacteroidetes bacterium]|nr:hypothetical protein [Bacteroidota bacterium]